MALLTTSEMADLVPLIQSLTVSKKPDEVFGSALQGLPSIPLIKPPKKWQMWLDSLDLKQLLAILDCLGPLPAVESTRKRLNASLLPADDWYLLNGVLPIIDRKSLRDHLVYLEQGATRILVVYGARFTGKSFTRDMLQAYLHAKPGHFLAHLDLLGARRVSEVAKALAMRLDAGDLPAQGDSALDFWVRELAEHLLIAIDKKAPQKVWLILDSHERAKPEPEVAQLLQNLARGVFERRSRAESPRLILLDHLPDNLPYDSRIVARSEELRFLAESDVFQCAQDIVEGDEAAFSTISKAVVKDLSEDELRHREMQARLRKIIEGGTP